MTVQQFNTIKEHTQLRYLLIEAACIGDRKAKESQVLLFQLSRQYVEVFFTPDCNEIINSRNFEDLEELQPYLEQISLPGKLKA